MTSTPRQVFFLFCGDNDFTPKDGRNLRKDIKPDIVLAMLNAVDVRLEDACCFGKLDLRHAGSFSGLRYLLAYTEAVMVKLLGGHYQISLFSAHQSCSVTSFREYLPSSIAFFWTGRSCFP